jgi:hypothetical protein
VIVLEFKEISWPKDAQTVAKINGLPMAALNILEIIPHLANNVQIFADSSLRLSPVRFRLCWQTLKAKHLLPIILMVVFAVSRWPGLMPPNFSAVYAMMFCAGVYFPKRLVWWLPFATLFATDLLLNAFYYHVSLLHPQLMGNYLAYAALVLLGRIISARAPWFILVAGGLLGAILFYLISNTIAWLFEAEYAKTFAGWLQALTLGLKGWPQTWEFFGRTLGSSGLFTGLFVAAMKFADALEPVDEPEEEQESAPEKPEEQPEEAKAS